MNAPGLAMEVHCHTCGFTLAIVRESKVNRLLPDEARTLEIQAGRDVEPGPPESQEAPRTRNAVAPRAYRTVGI